MKRFMVPPQKEQKVLPDIEQVCLMLESGILPEGFWIDKRMSSLKPIKGYHQIVGHSKVNDIQRYDYEKDPTTSITFIDVLDQIPCKVHTINI